MSSIRSYDERLRQLLKSTIERGALVRHGKQFTLNTLQVIRPPNCACCGHPASELVERDISISGMTLGEDDPVDSPQAVTHFPICETCLITQDQLRSIMRTAERHRGRAGVVYLLLGITLGLLGLICLLIGLFIEDWQSTLTTTTVILWVLATILALLRSVQRQAQRDRLDQAVEAEIEFGWNNPAIQNYPTFRMNCRRGQSPVNPDAIEYLVEAVLFEPTYIEAFRAANAERVVDERLVTVE